MSVPHHEFEQQRKLLELFAAQQSGTARREFPDGRMSAEDDGLLTYQIATDDRHRLIRIRFPKLVSEIGLDIEAAETLRDQLTERLHALRGIT